MRYLFYILITIWSYSLYAQNDSTSTKGEIISGEVIIEKDKKIVLPKADKIYVKDPPRSFDADPLNLQFEVKEPSFEWPDYKSDVPFEYEESTYPVSMFQNYVKAGYGNFGSPLLEAGFFHTFNDIETRSKLYYESFARGPVGDENSGNSVGGVDLSATYKSEFISITPSIQFESNRYRFYGNTNSINTGFNDSTAAKVSLTDFDFNIDLIGKSEDVTYGIKPFVNVTNQNLVDGGDLSQETWVGANGYFDYKLDERFTTGIDLYGASAEYDGGLEYTRSLINVNPWLKHAKENFSLRAGFLVSSGKIMDSTETGFYPDLALDYYLTEKWTIYGKVSGGQEFNPFNDLMNQNPYLDDSLVIGNIENELRVVGGVKGSPIKNLLIDASISQTNVNGLPFYIPSASDSSRFTLAYDDGTTNIFSLRSSATFMPTSISTYGASIELNSFSMNSLDRAWHMPTLIFKVYTSHNINEKLIVSGYLTSMSGIKAPANVDFGIVNLSGFTDVGVGAKYLFSQRASAFIDVNNLLNSEYERYLGYPTRALAFKIGGQFRF